LILKNLLNYIDAHKNEFRDVFKKKDWLIIEALIKAFEGEKPDWNFLINHKKVNDAFIREVRRKKVFQKALNKYFEDFNREAGINMVPTQIELLKSKKFLSDLSDLIEKHSKRMMKRKRRY